MKMSRGVSTARERDVPAVAPKRRPSCRGIGNGQISVRSVCHTPIYPRIAQLEHAHTLVPGFLSLYPILSHTYDTYATLQTRNPNVRYTILQDIRVNIVSDVFIRVKSSNVSLCVPETV